ncbi:MAG: hypothetical protein CMA66_07545 [Euryarchaeota archaeon]|nr:hypothetical protein [Euryarchaeota archaeon]
MSITSLMSLKDKVRALFESDDDMTEQVVESAEESHEDQQKFLAMAEEITDDLLNQLNDDDEVYVAPETILVSEYDVGDVDHDQLTDDEKLVSHSDVNVVQHETLDEIVEHLADAQIIGDIPVEVEF